MEYEVFWNVIAVGVVFFLSFSGFGILLWGASKFRGATKETGDAG